MDFSAYLVDQLHLRCPCTPQDRKAGGRGSGEGGGRATSHPRRALLAGLLEMPAHLVTSRR